VRTCQGPAGEAHPGKPTLVLHDYQTGCFRRPMGGKSSAQDRAPAKPTTKHKGASAAGPGFWRSRFLGAMGGVYGPGFWRSRFLGAMGGVYACAFISYLLQFPGCWGNDGLLPVKPFWCVALECGGTPLTCVCNNVLLR
jgi:hypothetical protein